jgi:hypothetical protein
MYRNVVNEPTLRNNPEERRAQLQRGGSLKSCSAMFHCKDVAWRHARQRVCIGVSESLEEFCRCVMMACVLIMFPQETEENHENLRILVALPICVPDSCGFIITERSRCVSEGPAQVEFCAVLN